MEDNLESFIFSLPLKKGTKLGKGGKLIYEVTPGIGGTVEKWNKREGDTVKEYEIICEILVIYSFPSFSLERWPVRSPVMGRLHILDAGYEGEPVEANTVIAEIDAGRLV